MPSIQSSSFWTNISSSGVYQGCISCSSTRKSNEHQANSLFGRLVCNKSVQKTALERQRNSHESPCQTRFHDKLKEIVVSSNTEHSIHRGTVSIRSGDCLANSRESKKITSSNTETSNRPDSSRFSSSTGCNGFMYRNNTKCMSIHETNTNAFTEILETSISDNGCQNSLYTRPKTPLEMVVRFSKHIEGQIFSTMGNAVDHNYGCFFNSWLGGHMGSQIAQGTWTESEKALHINYLEMEAVLRTVQHFLCQIKGQIY